jgi:hypothetical protein
VCLYRGDADVEPVGDLRVGQTLGDQVQHSSSRAVRPWTGRGVSARAVARGGPADAVHQVGGRRVLEQEHDLVDVVLVRRQPAHRPSPYGCCTLDPQTMGEAYGQIVTWTQSGELTFDVVKVPLSDIETAWQRTDLRGSRLVVVP